MINLAKETERLKETGVDFKFYDSSIEGYIGVVVRCAEDSKDTTQYDENVRKLTEAGYYLKGKYRKKKNCELFIIKIEVLEKLLE